MQKKSRDAFRTISEVAEWLDVPTHVLRFWESRFSQIKPVKRAGGRRYYRPSDMRVIGGVKSLLHDQGMTIRGVQKLFREEGIKHVSSFSAPLHGETGDEIEAATTGQVIEAEAQPAPPAHAARTSRDATPDPIIDVDPPQSSDDRTSEPADTAPLFSHRAAPPASARAPEPKDTAKEPTVEAEVPEATSDTETDAPTGEPEAPDTPQLDLEPKAEKPTIPETPDVPTTDPADDSKEFAKGPGVAARLRTVSQPALAANRADLLAAAERLRTVLDRAH